MKIQKGHSESCAIVQAIIHNIAPPSQRTHIISKVSHILHVLACPQEVKIKKIFDTGVFYEMQVLFFK